MYALIKSGVNAYCDKKEKEVNITTDIDVFFNVQNVTELGTELTLKQLGKFNQNLKF